MECYLNEKFNNMQGKESAINYDYYHLKDKLEVNKFNRGVYTSY